MLLFEKDFPDFLLLSPYLTSLLENGPFPEAGIEIPEDCAKNDSVLENEHDLRQLLSTLRFWLLTECIDVPKLFFKYAFDPAHKEIMSRICEEFGREFKFLAYVSYIVGGEDEHQLKNAVFCGCLSIIQYLCEEQRIEVKDELLVASALGRKDCLSYFHSLGHPLTSKMANVAAHEGQISILNYLHESSIVMDINVVKSAAFAGQLDCLQFALDRCPAHLLTNKFVSSAIAACVDTCKVNCLEYLWDRFADIRSMGDEWYILYYGAAKGHVGILRFGRARQLESLQDDHFSAMLVTKAVCEGQVSCLDYLYSIGLTAGPNCMEEAVERGHLECVKCLFAHDCPFQISICCVSAEYNHQQVLQWAHETGQPWYEDCCNAAACKGHIECLRYAHEHGCPWEEEVNVYAARAPTAACLQYVVEQGATVSVETARAAASCGHLACLQYLHAVRCPWDVSVCWNAARVGSLECLRFLHEHGCPWDQRAADVAVVPECVEYILQQQHQEAQNSGDTT